MSCILSLSCFLRSGSFCNAALTAGFFFFAGFGLVAGGRGGGASAARIESSSEASDMDDGRSTNRFRSAWRRPDHYLFAVDRRRRLPLRRVILLAVVVVAAEAAARRPDHSLLAHT